jgi:glycosyltransferase involved in cell wall biosynthesis
MRTDEIDFTAEGRARVRAQLGIPADAFVVGLISRFHPKKRNDVVIDAVRALDDPRAHLIVAGSGETEAELRARAASLDGRAHFVDTPRDEIADVLSAFDVSVFCPSPTEGAPRATILGMLARRAVLSTGREGVHDMIAPEFGAIAEPENDPAALAALLRRYLDDPALAARQGEAARAHAERTYAAPVVAEQLERLLRDASR